MTTRGNFGLVCVFTLITASVSSAPVKSRPLEVQKKAEHRADGPAELGGQRSSESLERIEHRLDGVPLPAQRSTGLGEQVGPLDGPIEVRERSKETLGGVIPEGTSFEATSPYPRNPRQEIAEAVVAGAVIATLPSLADHGDLAGAWQFIERLNSQNSQIIA